MAVRTEQLKNELTEQVVRQVRERLDGERAAMAERFVRQFYANVPPEDVVGGSADRLYGAALAVWRFGERRAAGETLVRVYNPRVERDGWQSPRTVVEIVNDDMPFLVDSVTAELNRQGWTVQLVIHPVVHVTRDAAGHLTGLDEPGASSEGAQPESYMHVEVSAVADPAVLERARAGLVAVLADVRAAVADWRAMRERAKAAADEAEGAATVLPAAEIAEARAFLEWLNDDHFTFLGARDYRFQSDDGAAGEPALALVEGSGLGILRNDAVTVFDGLRHFASLPPDVRDFLRQPRLLMVTKGNRKATVHRPSLLDAVLVKRFDAEGRVVGERLLIGLFTSSAYHHSPREIPLLRHKVTELLGRAGFDPRSHNGKGLLNILETYPRDELFQATTNELFETALGILHLQERQRLELFVRRDPFERFVSCQVFVPRDRFDTALRLKLQAILETAFNGSVTAFATQLGDGALARLHVIVRTEPGKVPAVDVNELEARLVQAARAWEDRLRDALVEAHGEEKGLRALARWRTAFPAAYQERVSAEAAVADIDRIERVEAGPEGALGIALSRPLESDSAALTVRIVHAGRPVPLSDILPMMERLDLRVITEEPFALRPEGAAAPVWIHAFSARAAGAVWGETGGATSDTPERFQEALAAVWDGRMEDDGLNRLILRAGLSPREVVVLRAYTRYLRQARLPYAQDTVESTLVAHPAIARGLVTLFRLRFDPALRGEGAAEAEAAQEAELMEQLDAVTNLDDDRILRRFVNVIRATLRTNHYQTAPDGRPKVHLSVKLDSRSVTDLPLPRPWVEVFVYSPRMEGVHLRGGPVARGGIRWSDRREDFRTEILGLMKAQTVKNAVIVPGGSKGGFVVKRPPPASAGRDAFMAEGIACYKTLMAGLLDITDNYGADASVVPPSGVVRHDADDPYLVVAADKGTATFSDIANGVAIDYGFWLGDAFASGGSAGYDHKKMGITARGAWESVKRHFRELGRDIQAEDFTVVGVGDMSGDVFGNGMLLSKHIKLTGAFDHRHIFCDPDPDPAVSWAERRRLFDLPRSSWADYDASLLSAGGRIYERGAKTLALTPQIQARFGLSGAAVTPQELMQAMLKADTDLLWFGGIGTYIKASEESHADAGDKANDAQRIDAAQLRAKVVGEGANLAVTQRARIEAGRHGVRLNTDAIDNSAGVDTSDHEVNIKILLNDVVVRGDMTVKQRDVLLAEMTDEVAALVLADNYLQTQALTLAESQGSEALESHGRLIRVLEKQGLLDRRIEVLPDDEGLAARLAERRGLTRPELAVLLAYAKITLVDELIASDLPDDPFIAGELTRYFPRPLRKTHAEAIERHRLRREIVATGVTNSIVNRMGPAFVRETMEKTGMGAADVARAYAVARDAFRMAGLWTAIGDLDTKVPAACQTAMLLETVRLLERVVGWFLSNLAPPLDGAAALAEFGPGIATLTDRVDAVLDPEEADRLARRVAAFTGQGVPEELARRVAALPVLAAAPDLVRIAARTGRSVSEVASVYFVLGRRFGLEWLRDVASGVRTGNHWQKQALGAIVDDLFAHQTQLTVRVLEAAPLEPATNTDGPLQTLPDALVDHWAAAQRGPAVERVEQLLAELRAQAEVDLSMLAVANRQLRGVMAG